MKKTLRPLKQEKGMTLIELILGLAILAMVMTAFLPMSVLVRKTILTNRAHLIATQIVNSEIENIIAGTTPQNYNNPTDNPRLKVGVSTATKSVDGIVFTLTTDVEWVDDPSDGMYPDDPIPYDYKSIQVSASAPDYFSGTVTQYADFKTFLTREGADDPFAGVVVEVIKGWTNSEGGHDPVAGATVTLTAVNGGDTVILTTNDEGKALTPVTLPNGQDESDYTVEVSNPGMMMLPAPTHHNTLTASRWETRSIQIEMEEKSTLKLRFSGSHQGGSIQLDYPSGTAIDGHDSVTQAITAGQTEVTFSNLWPVGSGYLGGYTATINLMPYNQDFAISNGSWARWRDSAPGPPAYENLWKYRNDLNGWDADPGNYAHVSYYGDGENRLVSPLIDLSSFTANPNPGFEGAFDLTPTLNVTHSLNKGSTDSAFNLIYKSNSGAGPEASSGWQALPNANAGGIGASPQTFPLDTSSDMVNNFRLYFNASPLMNSYLVNKLFVNCQYTKLVHFQEPGQTLVLQVTANP